MKTLLALALVAPFAILMPFPTAQAYYCVPTAETFGVTAVSSYYVKEQGDFRFGGIRPMGPTSVDDRFEVFQEDNGIPGLQTTSGEACGAKPDTDMVGVMGGASTTIFGFYACTVGYVNYCPVHG